MAVDRALRAFAGGELGPRADRLDVALVEDQRLGQRDRRLADVRVGLARGQDRAELRVLSAARRLAAAEHLGRELRPELELLAGEVWKASTTGKALNAARVVGSEPPPRIDAVGHQLPAAGRVDREVRAVRVDVDRADAELGAAEDVRDRVGDGPDPRRLRVDEEGDADDDGAEVEGACDGRRQHRQRERRALVGAREVGVALDLDRARAGAGADRRDADLALRRAARVFCLGFAGAVGGRGDLRRLAVGDALELAAQRPPAG